MRYKFLLLISAILCISAITLTMRLKDDVSFETIHSDNIASVNACTIQNNSCEFTIDQQKFDVNFAQTPISEEEIRFTIRSHVDFELIDAWIEGINMYMGKSPVIVENAQPTRIDALFFLGSCNLKTMEWQMTLRLKNKTHPIQVRFFTTRP